MLTKLRDNSCKNPQKLCCHRCTLVRCNSVVICIRLHLFSVHTHIHFCFCLHGFGAVLTHVIPIRAAFVVFRVFVSRIFGGHFVRVTLDLVLLSPGLSVTAFGLELLSLWISATVTWFLVGHSYVGTDY